MLKLVRVVYNFKRIIGKPYFLIKIYIRFKRVGYNIGGLVYDICLKLTLPFVRRNLIISLLLKS